MAKIIWFLLVLFLSSYSIEAYKILVFFPIPGKSHSILGGSIANHLLDAGHEVTYITPFEMKAHKNLTQINVIAAKDHLDSQENVLNINALLNKQISLDDSKIMLYLMNMFTKLTYETENVKKLLADTTVQFDLVIIEWMFTELSVGLSAVYNCPFIWVSTIEPHWLVMKLVDESLNPAYNADSMSTNIPPLSFRQRVQELWNQITLTAFKSLILSEKSDYETIFAPLMAARGKSLPSIDDLKYNASLILGNTHVSMGQAITLPQIYKPIGGYHISREVQPLPEDLKAIMDNAKHGVIYFSMGSNLNSKDWPEDIKKGLLKMFSGLKHTVLWKFEEALPDVPPNVHIMEWAPQQSILSHPNLVLFITHGGLLSTSETIHFGVPIIGIPVYGDQLINVYRAVERGIGKKVDFSYTLVEDLKVAIEDMTNNPRYREKVKELSLIYHDRVATPAAELVHWVEHVVRTRGAPHLRSPALHVPFYQKMYLDLIALIVLALCATKMAIKRIFFSRKVSNKQKKNN